MAASAALAALSVIINVLPASGAPARSAAVPNMVLLMGDDHGWRETGYNGHPHIRTPILDTMAATGLRLDRFYAAHPMCSPTRASVLTGRHPVRYGAFSADWSIRPEEVTIAHLLRRAGYVTAHFGKWHVGPVKSVSPTNPGAMGFDEWLSHDAHFGLNPSLSRNGDLPRRFAGEGSQIIIDEATRFIARAKRRRTPFLAVVWFGSPHAPFAGLRRDLALYDDLPARYAGRTFQPAPNARPRPAPRPLGAVLRERYAEITAMDRAIGSLRQYLKDQELYENTLVWYVGDNGTPRAGRAETVLRGRKRTLYEGGIRVPGIIEWPARVRAPRTSSMPAVTSDILPTLAGLAGMPIPDRPLDGISLEGLIDGEMTSRPTPIFWWNFDLRVQKKSLLQRILTRLNLAPPTRVPYIEPALQTGTVPVETWTGPATIEFLNFRRLNVRGYSFTGPRVVMDDRYKLVVDATRGAGVELFDLRNDAAETQDLAAREPAAVRELERRLGEWQDSVLESLNGADYR